MSQEDFNSTASKGSGEVRREASRYDTCGDILEQIQGTNAGFPIRDHRVEKTRNKLNGRIVVPATTARRMQLLRRASQSEESRMPVEVFRNCPVTYGAAAGFCNDNRHCPTVRHTPVTTGRPAPPPWGAAMQKASWVRSLPLKPGSGFAVREGEATPTSAETSNTLGPAVLRKNIASL